MKSALANWTPEQIENGRKWADAWKRATPELERIRREELMDLDVQAAIGLLCGPADYSIPPRAPKPFSGLVEQQHWFKKLANRE